MYKQKKRSIPRVITIAILLLISISVGFVYDLICTNIERRMYPTVYNDYVEKNAAAYGIPPEIIYAVIKTESGFRHDVVSSQGAVGLMQIMPDTFTWLLTKTGEDLGLTELYNPAVNIKYGTYLLSILHDELPAWDNVYAAYNAGIGNARNWLKDSRYTKNGVITNAPLSETSSYIIKVNKAVKMYQKLYF